MEMIEAGGLCIRVVRSAKRKTVVMRVAADGIPEMLAPRFCSVVELKEIALKHADKLREYLVRHRERESAKADFELRPGSELRFLGGMVTLTERPGDRAGYENGIFFIPPGCSAEQAKAVVIRVYKLAAKNIITPKVAMFAERMGLRPVSVKINSARSHWASCSARDTLNFSWFLAMARPSAIDYVVVHELCHMMEFNHSPRFWKLVGEQCPDYEREKLYLKELWEQILHEDWQ